jgi:hypothetical protein
LKEVSNAMTGNISVRVPAPMETGEGEPLAGVLSRMADELRSVAGLVAAAEAHLDGVRRSAGIGAEVIRDFQNIDMALQTLSGLAEFMETLGHGLPETLRVDTATALNVVKLADMRRRLAEGDVAEPARQRVSGDLDLF